MFRRHLARLACVLVIAAAPAAVADVTGKLDLPPAAAPPLAYKGFLDRVDNPILPVRGFDPTPYLVVVLVPATPPAAAAGSASWELLGETFARPLVPVRTGTEVTIKNKGKRAVTLTAAEDPGLVTAGPINIGGTRAITPKAAGVFTLTDKDIPHLRGWLVVVDSPYFAVPGRDGAFEIKDVPAGEYKVRVWYQDGWLERTDESLTVPARGDVTVSPKVPAGFKLEAKK
jgi:hypothetical protein